MKLNSCPPEILYIKAQELIKLPVKAFIGLLLAQVLSRNFPPPPVESAECPGLLTDCPPTLMPAGNQNHRSSASLLSQCYLIRSCDKLKIRSVWSGHTSQSLLPPTPPHLRSPCALSLSLSLTLHLSKYNQPLHFRYWPTHAVSLYRGETERPE